MSIKLLTLAAVAHFIDNGDDSASVTLYNNRDELAAELEESDADYSLEDIESGDDPYRTGAISDVEIDLEYDPATGRTRLASSFTFFLD